MPINNMCTAIPVYNHLIAINTGKRSPPFEKIIHQPINNEGIKGCVPAEAVRLRTEKPKRIE